MRRCSEFGPIGKGATWILVGFFALMALVNIATGDVRHPWAFGIILMGFVLFAVSKLSVILQRRWISFGTGPMSPRMANCYRLGYWLMVLGVLTAFV